MVIAAAVFCGAAMAQAGNPGLYLFQIPSTRGAAVGVPLSDMAQVDLHVSNPAHLAERLANTSVSIVAIEDKLVRITAGRHETLTGDPLPTHREATFVVDFEDAPVAALVEALRTEFGATPSLDELIQFVHAAIAHKTYRRSFDLASQVASSREGDCTEHAVLLAAMARATGRPARVVLGIMLMESPDRLSSFGHAWTEIHDDESWRIADATRPELQLPDARPRYLPLMPLGDEGLGYALHLLDLTTVYPARIDWIQVAERSVTLAP